LDERGLEAALLSQARRLGESDIACSVRSRVDARPDPTTETMLYRVVQEAISNVLKHSGAGNVEIELTSIERGVFLVVEDDGVGFDPMPPAELFDEGHLGLRGMQERVQMAGGRWDVDSAPGRGTRLTAFIPA